MRHFARLELQTFGHSAQGRALYVVVATKENAFTSATLRAGGKPTLLAGQNDKAIFGLPGHPVSALIVAQLFLAPFLKYLQGGSLEKGPPGQRVTAKLATSIHSTIGLEDYVRVRLQNAPNGARFAHPVFGRSGMLSTMVKADGVVVVPLNTEGYGKGDVVEVIQI